jgi:hypothetical protein
VLLDQIERFAAARSLEEIETAAGEIALDQLRKFVCLGRMVLAERS